MDPYKVDLRQVPRVPTAVIRRRVPKEEYSRFVPEACGLVWNALQAQGVRGGHHMALYREAGAVVEAGAELPSPFTPAGEIILSELPGGLTASTIHYGPYGGLGAAHAAVRTWCKANGHAFGQVCWELYGHWQDAWTADPSQIRTDVFYELADPRTR